MKFVFNNVHIKTIKMNNRFFLFIFLMFTFSITQAQNDIRGKVLDENNEPVSFANIILNLSMDSSMVKLEYTDDNGVFEFPSVENGDYFLTVSYVGYKEFNLPVMVAGDNKDLGTISLEVVSNELKEVTVSATRPILEVKPDKLIFNVEGSVNAQGNDGLELLRKAPGVVIDNNDNISLAGKSGVRIFIDGKPSPLGGEDLANFLKSMDSSNIDNIEIITNPSAKYEAAGNAGIINIKLKKDKNHGSNTTLTAGYGVGQVQVYNAGVTSNFRNKKANVFGSYNYNGGSTYWRMDSDRVQNGIVYNMDMTSQGPRRGNFFKFGTDFFLGKKQTIGFLINGGASYYNRKSDSSNELSTFGVEGIDSTLVSDTESDTKQQNYNFNLNYKYDIGKSKSLNLDVDYGIFRNRREEDQPNIYMAPDGTVLSERNFYTEAPTDIDIITFKVDYEQPLWGGQLGFGAKTALVNTDNTFDFYDVVNNSLSLDTDRSSQFEYRENVNAAYVTYAHKIGKFNVSGGLRMEQTNTFGELTSYMPENDPEPVERHYLDFFPSGGISYQPNRKNSLALNYSRRLDRPNYQNLNPFEYKTNELSFRSGNPFLRPQYTHNISLSHTFNYRYTTTIGFSKTLDMMSRITDTDGRALILTWLNISEQDNYSLTFSAPITITKWWSSFTNVSAFHLHNKAAQNEEIKTIDVKVTAASFYSQHTFSLPWKLKFELSGWGSTPSVWGGVFRTQGNFSIDTGLQRKFLDNKLSVRLAVSDIFRTAGWEGRSEYGEAVYDSTGNWDSRRFKINLSYSFGNQNVKSRKRKTGLDDEIKRASGGSGNN